MSIAIDQMNVLVVDDNPMPAKLLAMVLDEIGVARVTMASSGEKAIEILTSDTEKVDLVICDNQMPGMSGLEVLAETRKTLPDLPFVMITGDAGPDFVAAAEKLGVTGHVAKPFTPQQIEQTIQALAAGG